MKHYAQTKWAEYLTFEEPSALKPKTRKELKHSYRQRERAALKRELAAEIEEERYGYRDAERRYWWREFERCEFDEMDLEDAEEYLRYSDQWTPDHARIFAMAYREIRRRSQGAYEEWWEVAA